MDLYTPPFDLEIELLLQFFDDTFADVAERSDVIGEDADVGGHGKPLSPVVLQAVLKWPDHVNRPGLTRAICVSFALTKVRFNLFELFQRRFKVFDDLSWAMTPGSGRLSDSERDSSFSQKMSRPALSRATNSL
jgi:hypothetical protein